MYPDGYAMVFYNTIYLVSLLNKKYHYSYSLERKEEHYKAFVVHMLSIVESEDHAIVAR